MSDASLRFIFLQLTKQIYQHVVEKNRDICSWQRENRLRKYNISNNIVAREYIIDEVIVYEFGLFYNTTTQKP